MLKHPFLFVLGFAIGYLPALSILANYRHIPVSSSINSKEIQVVLETDNPTHENNKLTVLAASDSVTPEPTETETPSPTLEPTPAPTLTPTPVPTETPVPTATPDVWSPPEFEPWFSQYAGQFGVDKNLLERIANCESHFNPNASNGNYLGMFQFSVGTWQNYRMQMGLDANPDLRLSAEESIKTAAFVVQQRGISPWPACLR